MPPLIVLDTNIFVAAGFNPGSSAARILDDVRQGRLNLVWDQRTREETLHILGKIPPLRSHAFGDLFRPEHEHAAPDDLRPFAIVPDPADRPFAALAAAADATLLTNDHHLLDVRDQIPARVRTPGEFLRDAPARPDADALDR